MGDLIKEMHMTLDQVWKLGYYEAWRLWYMLDELKARDLDHLHQVLDSASGATDEYRDKVSKWLVGRQPRRFPPQPKMSAEAIKRFEERWNNGG